MNKSVFSFLGLLVCFSFICCSRSSVNSQSNTQIEERSDKQKGYKIGDTATDFNLKNVDGNFYSLSNIENAKGYIVVFTSNVCPFAVLYQDRLIDLHNKMAPQGYPVVAINSNDATLEEGDSYANMKIRAKEENFPFLYLDDAEQKIYPRYGATKTPHVFLLDKKLVVQYIGAIDDNSKSPDEVDVKYVENAISALQNGKLPNPSFTKAIGCPIKSNNVMEGNKSKPQRGGRKGPPSPDKILEKMDKNKDGKVGADEVEGPLKNDFTKLDKNSDGFLTVEELSGIRKKR